MLGVQYKWYTLSRRGNWDRLFNDRLRAGVRDPDDDKYLEAATGGKAQALVSGDKDPLVLYLWIFPSLRRMVCRRYMPPENKFAARGHKA